MLGSQRHACRQGHGLLGKGLPSTTQSHATGERAKAGQGIQAAGPGVQQHGKIMQAAQGWAPGWRTRRGVHECTLLSAVLTVA